MNFARHSPVNARAKESAPPAHTSALVAGGRRVLAFPEFELKPVGPMFAKIAAEFKS